MEDTRGEAIVVERDIDDTAINRAYLKFTSDERIGTAAESEAFYDAVQEIVEICENYITASELAEKNLREGFANLIDLHNATLIDAYTEFEDDLGL